MAAMSDYLEEALLKLLFKDTAFTELATVYVSLYTDDPGDDDSGTEVTGGSYARKSVAAAAWNAATPDSGGYLVDNNGAITFVTATASWGTITHFGIHDAATVGNLLIHGALDASKTVGSGDTFEFADGALDVTFK